MRLISGHRDFGYGVHDYDIPRTPAGVLEKVDGGYVFRYARFFDRLKAISL